MAVVTSQKSVVSSYLRRPGWRLLDSHPAVSDVLGAVIRLADQAGLAVPVGKDEIGQVALGGF